MEVVRHIRTGWDKYSVVVETYQGPPTSVRVVREGVSLQSAILQVRLERKKLEKG